MTNVQPLVRQHESLATVVGRLRALASSEAADAEEELVAALRAGIEELAPMLEAHLAFEESEARLADVVAEVPELVARAEALEGEHGALRQQLQGLLAPGDGGASPGYPERVLALLDALHRHERSETALLQEAMLRDEGGSG